MKRFSSSIKRFLSPWQAFVFLFFLLFSCLAAAEPLQNGFENPLSHGWDMVGEAEIVSGEAHTGQYSLVLGTKAKAILPVSENNVYGTVSFWVKDSMANKTATSPRDGPRFGLVNKDGDSLLVGVFRKSYLSKDNYGCILTAENNYYDQYNTAVPRGGGWQKWTIEATGSGVLNVYQNDALNANISSKEFFSKGFSGVYFLGGDAGDPEQFRFDDVTVEITGQGQVDSHSFPQARVTGNVLQDPNFFPIAVWAQPTDYIDYYKQMSVNVFVGEGAKDNVTAKQFLDALQAKGIYGIVHFTQESDHVYGLDSSQIQEVKNHPALLAWMFGDEPDNSPSADPQNLKQNYNGLFAIDSQRPVYLNLGSGVGNPARRQAKTTDYYGYCEATDIISYDIYPVSTYEEGEKHLYFVAQGIDNLKNWSNDKKPIWIWLEASRIGHTNRPPTGAEVKAEVWMSIIHGADGIGWFPHVFEPYSWKEIPTDVEQEMKSIGQTLTSLAPALKSQELPTEVTAEILAQGRVDISSRIYNGKLYFFAVNMNRKNAGVKFHLPVAKANASFSVINEARTVQASSGTFTEQFAPYEVHLYEEITGPILCGNMECQTNQICCNNACKAPACTQDANCNDNNAATKDVCVNPNTCTAACTNTPITQCINNDNYCPPGCKSTNDNDCLASCGNGAIDANENCSNCPQDVQCQQGKICCNNTCTTPTCNSDANCSTGQKCTSPSTCNATCTDCNIACSTDTRCNDNNTTTTDTCINAATCDAYCRNQPPTCGGITCNMQQICCNNTCTTPTCTKTSECDDNKQCTKDYCGQAGTCTATCTHQEIPQCGWKKMKWTLPSCFPIGNIFEVTITDETGQALEGVLIEYGTQKTPTDPTGKAELLGEKNQFNIKANKDGYYSLTGKKIATTTCNPTYTTQGGTTIGKQKINIQITDKPYIGQEFTVTITDTNNNQIQGATISYGTQNTTTNTQGKATLTGEKNQYLITATATQGKATTKILPTNPPQNTDQNQNNQTKPFTIPFDIIGLVAIILVGAFVLIRTRTPKT